MCQHHTIECVVRCQRAALGLSRSLELQQRRSNLRDRETEHFRATQKTSVQGAGCVGYFGKFISWKKGKRKTDNTQRCLRIGGGGAKSL